ncbi:MAG: hypothetical protein Q9182_004817 [Xanthomendoza sp. 2 TL-2023]
MGRLSVLAASTAVISLASAFCVDFNSADQCTGTVVGSYVGSAGPGCQNAFLKPNSSESVPAPGGSFNVIIQPQSNDSRTGVAFFGQKDCEVLIGFGNVPVCTGVGAWSSFRIITMDEADDELTSRDPAPIFSIPSNATAAVGRGNRLSVPPSMLGGATSSSTTTGSISTSSTSSTSSTNIQTSTNTATRSTSTSTTTATSDPIMSIMGTNTPGKMRRSYSPRLSKRITHGSIHEQNGHAYKYHQIAARAWRGIPVDEWDDNIHRKNTRDLSLPNRRSALPARLHARAIGPVGGSITGPSKRGISPRSLSPLERREISPSKCNLVRTCMIDSGDNEGFGIMDAGPALLSAVGQLDSNGDNWQFLRNPFVVEVTDDAAQSLGFIYARTKEHSGVTTCSEFGNEADAFKSALEMGVSGSTVSDMRVDLKLLTGSGVTNTLFVSTRKAGNTDMRIHPICEAIQLFD